MLCLCAYCVSLLVCPFPSTPPALRTLRTLRSISFFKGLQVLVKALIQTFRTAVLYLLLLLLVLMFLFAIMGYYFFGYEPNSDKEHWGDFGRAMLSLFALVTVGGARPLTAHLVWCIWHCVCE